MLNIRHILVPTDLTDEGQWTLRNAWTLAARFGAELHVFYADVLHGSPEASGTVLRSKEEIRARLEELTTSIAERDRDGSRVSVRLVVERNTHPAPAILAYADENDVDVIAMGTHGRRGVSRLVLGSVAEEVVRHAKCPVLTVRSWGGSVPDHVDVGSILVPFDFSTHSQNALAHAKEFAAAFGSRVDMLHVIEERLHPAFYGITVRSVYDIDPDIEAHSIERMRDAFESAPGPEVRVTYEARPGSAAREIVAMAEEKESSLILMGTHGLNGLDHFLLGSVTEWVLRRAPCPVLTLKRFGKHLFEEPLREAAA